MVIETPEGLTLVEPTENSSFYIVQENEGQKTPPGLTISSLFLRSKNLKNKFNFDCLHLAH